MDSIHNRFQDIPKLSGTNNWSVVNAMPSSSSRTKKLIKNQQINKMKQIAKNTQQQWFQELLGTDMGALAAVQAVK